jgi:hypothetical protein
MQVLTQGFGRFPAQPLDTPYNQIGSVGRCFTLPWAGCRCRSVPPHAPGEHGIGDIPPDRKYKIRQSCSQAHPRLCATADKLVRDRCLAIGAKVVDFCYSRRALFKAYMLHTRLESTGQACPVAPCSRCIGRWSGCCCEGRCAMGSGCKSPPPFRVGGGQRDIGYRNSTSGLSSWLISDGVIPN